MGTMDRPGGTGDQADVPSEVASESGGWKFTPSGSWLNLDNQTDRQLRAGHDGPDQPATPFDRPADRSGGDIEVPDGPLPRWRVGDPVEVPPIHMRTDVGPGKEPPDYKNPDAKDPLKVEPGQEVIVGKAGSEDNPRRYVTVHEGIRLADKDPDEPPPENPSGEDLLEPADQGRSLPRRVHDKVMQPETIESLDDLGKHITDSVTKAIGENPAPTGTSAGLPERLVDDPGTKQDLPSGNPLLAPVIIWAATQRVVDWLGGSRQTRGDHSHAGD